MVLYRPVGTAELRLIEESGWREYPPRLPEQGPLLEGLIAASWEGTGYWKAMLKSSFHPTRVESVPRKAT